jgi:hypothetical protein
MAEDSARFEQGEASVPSIQETVQYADGQMALRITGDDGARFTFDISYKHDPSTFNEAIISTASGNDYYITHDSMRGTYIVNVRETIQTGKLIAAYSKDFPAPLPRIDFNKPWTIPGNFRTSSVREVFLRYKIADSDSNAGRKLGIPDPFKKYDALFRKYIPRGS